MSGAWLTSIVIVALALSGCGSDDPVVSAPSPAGTPTPVPAGTPSATPAAPRPATVDRAHCAAGTANCTAVTGRVIYVEAVDPDGDGDAHYVVAGGAVTAPGVSVIDVGRDLRPPRLPKPGELVSAAGPVYTGSYGQQQIEAVELHHQHARRG